MSLGMKREWRWRSATYTAFELTIPVASFACQPDVPQECRRPGAGRGEAIVACLDAIVACLDAIVACLERIDL
jgi:hypothetical protein